MPDRSLGYLTDLARTALAALHVLLMLAAVAVPIWAAIDAGRSLLDPVGSEQLGTVFNAGRWLALLGNTAIVCGVAVTVAVGLGLGLGILVARTDMPGGRIVIAATLFGACVPAYVVTVFVLAVIPLATLTRIAAEWGAPNHAIPWLVAGFCGLISGLVYLPLATLILAAAVRGVDRDLEDQALLDASPGRVCWRVTIPQAGWGIIVVGMVIVLLVGTDFTVADVFGVRTFAEECYSQYQLDHRRAGPLLTGLPVLAVLGILLVTVQMRYRLLGEHPPWSTAAVPRPYPLGRWRWKLAAVCGLLAAIGAGVPLACLLRHLRPNAELLRAAWILGGELWRTMELSAAGALAVVAVAAGLAWALVRGGWTRWPVAAATVVLLATPAPVVGITLITLANNTAVPEWVRDHPGIVVAGYFVRFLPIGVLLLVPAAQRVSRELEWAARVDGADWLGVHAHVRWPAVARDALLAGLVVAVLCFGEVGATVLLVPPGRETAAVRAFTLLHFGVYSDLALLALLSTACILLPWGLLAWLLRGRLCGSPVARRG